MKRAGFETSPTEMHDDPDWFEGALGGGGCQGGANDAIVGHCRPLKNTTLYRKLFWQPLNIRFLADC